MNSEIATTIWELGQKLSFDEPLSADDERFVDTESARGDFSFTPLLRPYGVDLRSGEMKFVPNNCYSLFCGHRGCGKSTELRRLEFMLDRPDRFFVVFLDALKELDIHNLSYTDLMMSLAKALLQRITAAQLDINPIFLTNLQKWFSERIEKHEKTRDFAAEIKAGAEGSLGIPFLYKLFANLTTSFKFGSTYKEELRTVIRNSFAEFALAFQQLMDAAADAVKKSGRGHSIVVLSRERMVFEY